MKVALQFIAMGLVWGASFLFMKVGLEGVSFGQVVWARLVFGAVTLGVIAIVTRSRLPREPIVVGPWQIAALSGSLWGQLACLGAVTCYGFSFGYIRRFISHRAMPATTIAVMNIGVAAAIMVVLTPVIAWGPITFSWPVLLSLLALGALGTGVVYIWNMNVLRAWGPTATSGVTYVTPVVGVALGILVLGETLSWNEPVGAAVVLAGILLTQQRVRLFTRRQAEMVDETA